MKELINGLIILEPTIFKDDRGYFFESYNKKKFEKKIGKPSIFVQDNESKSTKGVIRGLHFQIGDHAQSKLVRVTKGEVFDVAVDIRKNSKTFGQWYGVILSQENKKQFYIPKGFAHGFQVLSNEAIFNYKCDHYYHKDSEGGIIYNDKDLKIDWPIKQSTSISQKDAQLPTFAEVKQNDVFITF